MKHSEILNKIKSYKHGGSLIPTVDTDIAAIKNALGIPTEMLVTSTDVELAKKQFFKKPSQNYDEVKEIVIMFHEMSPNQIADIFNNYVSISKKQLQEKDEKTRQQMAKILKIKTEKEEDCGCNIEESGVDTDIFKLAPVIVKRILAKMADEEGFSFTDNIKNKLKNKAKFAGKNLKDYLSTNKEVGAYIIKMQNGSKMPKMTTDEEIQAVKSMFDKDGNLAPVEKPELFKVDDFLVNSLNEGVEDTKRRFAPWYKDRYNSIDADIIKAAKEKGANPNIVKAFMLIETGMKPSKNSKGYQGYPQTNQDSIDTINKVQGTAYTLEQMNDPYHAANYIIDYMRTNEQLFGAKDLQDHVIAYNYGPARLKKYKEGKLSLDQLPTETKRYINDINKLSTIIGF